MEVELNIHWNLVNMNTINVKYLLYTNHFEIPRHYNINTASYSQSEIPANTNWWPPGVHINVVLLHNALPIMISVTLLIIHIIQREPPSGGQGGASNDNDQKTGVSCHLCVPGMCFVPKTCVFSVCNPAPQGTQHNCSSLVCSASSPSSSFTTVMSGQVHLLFLVLSWLHPAFVCRRCM